MINSREKKENRPGEHSESGARVRIEPYSEQSTNWREKERWISDSVRVQRWNDELFDVIEIV
jgi:hypothetical protein